MATINQTATAGYDGEKYSDYAFDRELPDGARQQEYPKNITPELSD